MRRSSVMALATAAVAFLLFWSFSFRYPSDRQDLFALADAFAHGRTWVEPAAITGPWDRIDVDGRTYLPFAPLPALAFVPLVAAFGVAPVGEAQALVNSIVAAISVGLAAVLIGRFAGRTRDRLWLLALFAFSTPLLSLTVRGGPWHQDQLFATACTLGALLEVTGRRRPLLVGLLAGAALLARTPTALAIPFYAWACATDAGRRPVDRGALAPAAAVAAGTLPALAFTLWYDQARFGSPFESGYGLAALPPFLEVLRAQGLFSLAHLPRNLGTFVLGAPRFGGPPLFARPDGFGLSVLLTSPGLLVAARADRRDPFLRACALTAALVFLPSLLYYGGGWIQVGFRYFLDAIPFLLPLAASAARPGLGAGAKALIAVGILVNLWAVPWLYGF